MAISSSSSARVLFEAFHTVRSRPSCQCLRIAFQSQHSPQQRRNVSTGSTQFSEMEVDKPTPRWAQTPPAMKAPFSVALRSIGGRHDVNKDPRRLDDMYTRLLGNNGPSLLSDETKWLAVTHKSFDHGRRGFNDRLSYFGKRVVELQASLGILSMSERLQHQSEKTSGEHSHPAIEGIEILTEETKMAYMNHKRIADVARNAGLPEVMRWVPKNPDNLTQSGQHLVYAQAVYAIIGALALEQGGAVANRITRERILPQLGIETPQITAQ